MLSKHYARNYHPELRIQYVDSEGDRIDVNTELEWNEMFDQLHGESVIKIYISEGANGKYFKDGPPAECLYFHDSELKTQIKPENGPVIASSVGKCLEQFFPNGRILPYNIPSFLQNIVTIKHISGNGDAVVDINVDISRLGDAIHRKAMDYLNVKEYHQASQTFRAQCVLQPSNPVAYYNVACSESLLGNLDEALSYLNQSIDKGYRDLSHMKSDEDFDNIRQTDGFKMACFRLNELINEKSPEPVKQEPEPTPEVPPEPTPEPVKQEPEPTPEVPETIPQPDPEPQVIPQVVDVPHIPQFIPYHVPEALPYSEELQVLHDIGYLNDNINIPILVKNKGNIQQTVLDLLDNNLSMSDILNIQ
jgi:tetratricopeptide (TPR) repeat protein